MSVQFRNIEQTNGASAANSPLVLTSPTGRFRKLLYVVVVYSATPVHSGISVSLKSGISAALDITLSFSSANAVNLLYTVPADVMCLPRGDWIQVSAPAGGVGLTSQAKIISELLE